MVCCDPHSQRLSSNQWSQNRCFFFWNSLAFSMIQLTLAIWSLVPLPFLNPAYTSEVLSSHTAKPSLKDFEHNLDNMWNEHNCTIVWTFFVIALLWDWNENWPFPILWPLLCFPNLLAYRVQHFHILKGQYSEKLKL